jgi:hypothetical protein
MAIKGPVTSPIYFLLFERLIAKIAILFLTTRKKKNETQNYCHDHIGGTAHHDDITTRLHRQCHDSI